MKIIRIKISSSKFYELHFVIAYRIILFTVKCEINWVFCKSIRFSFADKLNTSTSDLNISITNKKNKKIVLINYC